MKKITVLYLGGDIGHPTTGGQVYDYRFFNIIAKQNITIDFINDKTLGRCKNESVLKLPFRLISKLKLLAKNKILIFNTALFPYYIIPFYLLKIFYPHLIILGIHHHFRFQEQKGIKRKIYKFLEFINLKECTWVINPCPYTRDILLKYWKNGRVVTLENSFDIIQKPTSIYEPYRLLYVGSVYERKGLIYLLEALSLIPEGKRHLVVVDIVGGIDESSEYVKSLRRFVKDHKLENNVIFHGRVSDEELKEYYTKAYAFVLPSLLEGYGLVIIEAMSYGLPVIAFNNSAMPYTIQHEYNGLLAKDKDVVSLSQSILRLLDQPDLHMELATNAKEYSKKAYSVKQFRDDCMRFIDSL